MQRPNCSFTFSSMASGINELRINTAKDAETAYQQGKISLHETIIARLEVGRIETCVGRVIFNSLLSQSTHPTVLLFNLTNAWAPFQFRHSTVYLLFKLSIENCFLYSTQLG